MKKIIFLFLSFSNLFFIIFASDSIINIPLSKSVSLGEEIVLVNNGAFNVLTNPAMLVKTLPEYVLDYNRIFYYADTVYDLLGFSYKQDVYNIGLVLGKFSSGDIKVIDIEGNETEEVVNYTLTVLGFGLANKILSFNKNIVFGGISGYSILEKINTETNYFGFNIGLVYEKNFKRNFIKNFRLGLLIKNINKDNNFFHSESISLDFNKFVIFLGYQKYGDIRFATTINIYKLKQKEIFLNLGYNFNYTFKKYSFGLEFYLQSITLNFGLSNSEYLGDFKNLYLSFKL